MVLQLILFQIVTFAVIVVILRVLFGSQLKIALNRLQDLQQENQEKEEILNKEIERARAQSQSEISRSKEEARIILENARKGADRIAQEQTELAQVQARKILSEAAEHAKTMETTVTSAAASKAVSLAEELVVRIFTERGLSALHGELVNEFLEGLAKVDKERLGPSSGKVEIVNIKPLEADQRQKLEKLLREKLGRDVHIEEINDPNILMGVVLRIGNLVVDGSLRNKLHKAMDVLRQR